MQEVAAVPLDKAGLRRKVGGAHADLRLVKLHTALISGSQYGCAWCCRCTWKHRD